MTIISRLIAIAIWLVIFAIISFCSACSIAAVSSNADNILLTLENTVTLYGEITEDSVKLVKNKLSELNSKLPAGEPIYLVLDTNGGDVQAGLSIYHQTQMYDREVKTITLNSSSTGFILVQHLGERLITPNGILFSHEVSTSYCFGKIRSEIFPQVVSTLLWITRFESVIAARMGISLEQYQTLIFNDYQVKGKKAVEQKAADRVINVKCSKELFDSRVNRRIYVSDKEYKNATFSGCPMVRRPVKVDPEILKREISDRLRRPCSKTRNQ